MNIYMRLYNGEVELAGTIANEWMIDNGYFPYDGEIPEIDPEKQKLVYEDGILKAIDKPKEKIDKITLRQTKLILNQMGLLSVVERYINSIEDEKLKATAKIEWEYANDVERSNPLIAALQAGLNLSDMFREASKL